MTKLFIKNDHHSNKDNAPNINSNSPSPQNFKINSEDHGNRLEIRIISSSDQFQEIEIIYGEKKKRAKITRFLPKNLASDYLYRPLSTGVGATHLNSLKHSQTDSDLPLKEKLLNILAKINLLNHGTNDRQINYQKIWDGPQRIDIGQKFLALSAQEKQAMLDQESTKRSPYLSTPEKLILVAAINYMRPVENKVSRDIISHTFAEISSLNLFENFIKDVVSLINDKEKLLQHFFVNKDSNVTPEKNNNLIKQITKIFSETDEDERKHEIRALRRFVDQTTAQVISK